ncbi:MAG: DUF4388 domain-containing protein [Deltaproteobacteria bacterium]|nr:DUF4388 domain-containing protein [Deltaproteobacteria bacterium]
MKFKGLFSNFVELTNLIQMVCQSQITTSVRITRGKRSGYLFVDAGRITHAVVGARIGEEALYIILSWSEGYLETLNRKSPGGPAITTDLMSILMEAGRKVDEAAEKGIILDPDEVEEHEDLEIQPEPEAKAEAGAPSMISPDSRQTEPVISSGQDSEEVEIKRKPVLDRSISVRRLLVLFVALSIIAAGAFLVYDYATQGTTERNAPATSLVTRTTISTTTVPATTGPTAPKTTVISSTVTSTTVAGQAIQPAPEANTTTLLPGFRVTTTTMPCSHCPKCESGGYAVYMETVQELVSEGKTLYKNRYLCPNDGKVIEKRTYIRPGEKWTDNP